MKAAATLGCVALAGCSALPPCPAADATLVQLQSGEILIAFSTEAMQVWHDTIRAEARGECRVVKKGEV
jgi:hypothetical protein